MRALFLLLLTACSLKDIGGGTGLDLPFLDVVYLCTTPENQFEYCWNDDPEILADDLGAGTVCQPTPRHLGPCLYRCPSQHGCNALEGCYCP